MSVTAKVEWLESKRKESEKHEKLMGKGSRDDSEGQIGGGIRM